MLSNQIIFILIDPRFNYSYVSLHLVDQCHFNKEVHAESWLVQLAIWTKRRAHHWVRSSAFDLNGMPTSTHLTMLPFISYNVIFHMHWFFLHKTKVDYYEKVI